MEPKLSIKNLCYSYYGLKGECEALKDISFDINQGEFFVIVGPSGCGKTTLLSCLCGLYKPCSGSIKIDGANVDTTASRIGYMHQHDLLFDWRSNYKNIALSLEINPYKKEERLNLIQALLNRYNLSEYADKYPYELSGGMRQRIALIRTLVRLPEILLLDEPFSALDFQTRLDVAHDVYRIIRNEKKTAVLITHDIEEAISLGDKILVLTKCPASVMDIIDINLSIPNRNPLTARDAPEFSYYFHKIYKELRNE